MLGFLFDEVSEPADVICGSASAVADSEAVFMKSLRLRFLMCFSSIKGMNDSS